MVFVTLVTAKNKTPVVRVRARVKRLPSNVYPLTSTL